MSTRRHDPWLGHVLGDRYEVVRRVARGGMATVYEARDLRLSRTVAVKVMHDHLDADDDFAARFDSEARAAALLSHPNVVAVFDQGMDDGRPYIVMEFVSGCTLRQVITREAPLAPGRALDLLEPVATALGAAHAAGLVHRDVKPENGLISDRGQVKVADFGLAKAVADAAPAAEGEIVIGTVSYIAPEIVARGHADARSDVYSLGIVLYELLTGRKPHRGDTPLDVAYAHIQRDVPPPSASSTTSLVGGRIPDYLDALVATATSRTRSRRPLDAAVFAAHLRRAREALGASEADDPRLALALTARELDAAHAGPSRIPTLPASEVAPDDAGRELRFTPGFSPTPSFEIATDGVPYYSDGGPSPISPLSPATRGLPSLPPPRDWEHTPVYRRRRAAVALVALVLVLVLAVGGWYAAVGRLAAVPALGGLSRPDAVAAAQASGFTVAIDQEPSETVPAGEVSRTDPASGARVEPGATLRVWLSTGPERFAVPRLVGLTEDAAGKALSRFDLTPGTVSERYSDTVPDGTVISQGTPAGTGVPRGTTVDYVLSQGREPVTLPDLTGRQATDARATLKQLGLRARVVEDTSQSVPRGEVISQSPGASDVLRGDTIRLVVSRGPRLIAVPNVRGLRQDAAQRRLEDAGFRVTIAPDAPGAAAPGSPATQPPAAGGSSPAEGAGAQPGDTGAAASAKAIGTDPAAGTLRPEASGVTLRVR